MWWNLRLKADECFRSSSKKGRRKPPWRSGTRERRTASSVSLDKPAPLGTVRYVINDFS